MRMGVLKTALLICALGIGFAFTFKPAHHNNTGQAAQNDMINDEEPDSLTPKDIAPEYLKMRSLEFPLDVTPRQMLKALIPGNYYHIKSYDTVDLVAWTCKKLSGEPKADSLGLGNSDEDEFSFPDARFNQTRVSDTIHYSVNGKDYLLLALSTCIHNEVMLTGRFSQAQLGIALFKKERHRWKMQYFDPATRCWGQFATVPHINLLKAGNNRVVFYFYHPTGGFGMYEGDLVITGFYANKWQVFLYQPSAWYYGGAYNGLMYKPDLKPDKTADNIPFSDINIFTEGLVKQPDSLDMESIPKTLPETITRNFQHTGRDSIHFSYHTFYHFNNGKYEMVKQDEPVMK